MIERGFARMGIFSAEAEMNLALIKSAFTSLLSGDIESYWAIYADDVLTAEPLSLPYGGDYIGRDAARQLGELVLSKQYASVDYEIREMAAGGEMVFFLLEITFVQKGCGTSLKMPVAEMWRFRDGKVIENRPFIFDAGALARLCK
jgi:ketosteroid isomerase-like protein